MSFSGYARPKVNLTLHVTGKRSDGYHELCSLVVFAKGGDYLTVEAADQLSLICTGPFAAKLGSSDDNLVLRAAKALQAWAGIQTGAHIHLVKNLPLASGIGGGSADAACTLQLLCKLWDLDVPIEHLCEIGLKLGADIPACLRGQPLLMEGIGDILTPLATCPTFPMLLVNPGVAVSTPEIFKHLNFNEKTKVSFSRPTESVSFADIQDGANDLQNPAIDMLPQIKTVLDSLTDQAGCKLARMSGSGATCFALFEDEQQRDQAADRLSQLQADWWVYRTQLETVAGG